MTTTNYDAAFDAPIPLPDPFGDDDDPNGIARPPRTDDRVMRDKRGKPRILPVGERMPPEDQPDRRHKAHRSYARPSSYGAVLEDDFYLARWGERKAAAGLAMRRDLMLALAALGDTEESAESKEAANDIIRQAKDAAGASLAANEGTGLHALTERRDRGLALGVVPEEFRGNMEDWARLTEHFEFLDIECFVVQDEIKAAGTFDRLVRYHVPCAVCGAYVRVLDLKSGRIDYGAIKMAVQLAIYANSRYYVPETGKRVEFAEPVCRCSGIIVHVPTGQPAGSGVVKWLNIGQGWNVAVECARRIREIRRMSNWWLDFTPLPDLMPMIQDATTRGELSALYRLYRQHWTDEHTAAGNRRIEELTL